jgi:molecular chaperone GrpE
VNQTHRGGPGEGGGARPGPDGAAPPAPPQAAPPQAAPPQAAPPQAAPPQAAASAEPAQPEHPEQAKGAAVGDTIAEQAARIAELEDLRLRALADLDNARKRCAAQISHAEADTRAAVARQWLPVIDSLDLALAHATADPATIVDGVKAVRAQALDVLARLGFPRREDQGARFDPARHEAIASRPDPGAEADLVAEVIRPAYGEGDHQLRPAQVVVARPG